MMFGETYYQYDRCQHNTETLVFIHGCGLDLTVWDDIITDLKKHYHILRYDLPGHGRSVSHTCQPITWDMIVDQFKALLQHLNIKKAHIIGHGFGGNIGLELALRECEQLSSLTFIGTPILIIKRLARDKVFGHMDVQKTKEEIMNPIIQRQCYPPTIEKTERLQDMYRQITKKCYLTCYQLIIERLQNYRMERIRQLSIPMMMLNGENDVLCPAQLQLLNKIYLANIRLFTIPDAANIIMMDQPSLLLQFLRQFLDQKECPVSHQLENNYADNILKELQVVVDASIKQIESDRLMRVNFVQDFQLVIDGQVVHGRWNQRKAKQLVAYIAIHKVVTRDQLCDVFWPNYVLTKARNCLRVSLNHIKQILKENLDDDVTNYLIIGRETVEIRTHVTTDLALLMENLRLIERNNDQTQKAKQAIQLFASLPEVLFPSLYDGWIMAHRVMIEEHIISIGEQLLNEVDGEQFTDLLKLLIKFNPDKLLYYDQLLCILEEQGRQREIEYYKKKRLEQS